MILSFDKFERYELPQVTLCNPNSRATEVNGKITITDTVGVLSNPKGMNLKLNFNAPHELSFDYYRHKSSDPIKQSFYDSIYESIQTDRYIYLTDIGYFIISSVTDSDEDNIDRKSISLKSCEENELAVAEGLNLDEKTYYLHTENNDGLLDLFLPKTAGWTIGFIDPSLLTKPYFVEETEVDNGYNFLYTTIQDMFECIVEPDIIRRTISIYSRVYYAEHHLTDIHIAKYNLLKHKTVEENDEDKYTALNVQGKDENLEIRAVNPTGKNVIYNFEPRYSWMSPALQTAVAKWQEKCESVEDEYLTLQQGYYTELEKLFNEEQDIEVLKGELKTLEETRDAVLITTGEEQSTALDNVNAQISAKQTEINTKTSEYDTHKETVRTTYEVPISQINSDCALDVTAKDIDGNTIFATDLLNELMTHIKPTDYVDEYMLVTESMTYPQRFEKAKELMGRAQSQLIKISSGQKTYSIDTRSFLFNKQFKHFSEQLCAGAIIYVETKSDTMEQLHLTGIDISFDEKSTNFTLGNKYDRSDLKALYEDALGQNSKSFSELKYIAGIIEDQQKQLDYQRNWVADLLTLTLDNVLTSEDQAIEINNRGLIGRKRKLDENGEWDFDENGNPYFEDEQVKLINNTLVFTENNWETASTAVGKIAVGYNADDSVKYAYGINGQVLIGELILGNNLVLTGTGAGIKIKDSNGNNVFYADDEGNLVLSSTIFANAGQIGGWIIDEHHIKESGNSGLPKEYELVDYIETDGESYIDTEFIPNQNSGFEIDFMTYNTFSKVTGEFGCIFGTRQGSKTREFQLTTYIDGVSGFTNGTLRFGNNEYNADLYYNSRIVCKLKNQQYIQSDGGVINLSSEEFEAPCSLTIGALSQDSNGTQQTSQYGKVRIYSFKLYDGDTCVRNFVPVKYSDGTGGLYDLISGTFYGNSGTGSISIGSVSSWYTTLDSTTGSIISKSIIAKGGTIGGWTIENARLERDSTIFNTDGTWKSGYRVGMQNNASAVFYAGCKTASGGSIASESASNFYVTNAGYVFCNNIKAVGGTIAGWTIDNTKMYKASSWNGNTLANYGTGISSTVWSDDPAFYAGFGGNKGNPWAHNANTDSSGNVINGGWQNYTNFYVTNNGHLIAKSAEITGTIKAGSVLLNGVTLGSGGNTQFYDYNDTVTSITSTGTQWYVSTYNDARIVLGKSTQNVGFVYISSYGSEGSIVMHGASCRLRGNWLGTSSQSIPSDVHKKHEISTIGNQYSILFDNLRSVTYKYNDGTSDRLHTGFIAQEVNDALQIANIDSKDFAGLTIFDRGTENELWALRYEEFIALNTWQIQKAKARISELENTVAELKTQIQTLTAG